MYLKFEFLKFAAVIVEFLSDALTKVESEKLVLAKFVFSKSALFRLISLKLMFERLHPLHMFESRKLSSSKLLSCAKANLIVNNKKI